MVNVVILTGIVEAIQPPRQYHSPIKLRTWDYARAGRKFDQTIFVDIPNAQASAAVVGQFISVRGKFSRRSYEKNGQKVWVNEIRVFEATGVDTPPGAQPASGGHASMDTPPTPPTPPTPNSSNAHHASPKPAFDDDDIPF